VDKEALAGWALSNGWQMIGGHPSLTKPSAPKEAIVRLVLKATVATVEVKKPAGKWEKVAGAAYGQITADPDGWLPRGLGLEVIPSIGALMQDNRDRMVFARMAGPARS
jgi:Xaa-Pro aminopeptidase